MTIREMKIDLIKRFEAKKLKTIMDYKKKLAGMVSSAIEQEYKLVVLGQEYVPKKKEKTKKGKKEKWGDSRPNVHAPQDINKATEEDVKGVW